MKFKKMQVITPIVAGTGLALGIAGTTMSGVALNRLDDLNAQTQTNKLILNEIDISGVPAEHTAWVYADKSDQLHFFTLNGGNVILGGSGSFLPLVGGTMQGDINLNNYSLLNVLGLGLSELLLTPSAPTTGLQLYTQSNILFSIDSTSFLRQYVTTADLETYFLINSTNLNGLLLHSNEPIAPSVDYLTLYQKDDVLYSIDSNSIVKQYVTTDDPLNIALQVEADVIAPPGQRDDWRLLSPSSAAGPYLFYDEFLDVVVDFGFLEVVATSQDQGDTWSSTYDIAPTGPQTAGYNESLIVAIGNTTQETYTCTDGVTFVKGSNHPGTLVESYYVHWFSAASLFVVGVSNFGERIMTSPDGLTWTLNLIGFGPALTIKSNSTICVAVGSTAPYAMWSENGTVWTLTSTPISSTRSLEWSEDRKEFVSIGLSDNIVYQSTDGKTWTATGITVPQSMNDTLKWIPTLGRYYYSAPDEDGNYSLWSSTSPYQQFVGTHLDGASVNVPTYALAYLAAYNRFLIGLNDVPFVAIGTLSNKIKALSDDIVVRGAPVQVCKFSGYSIFPVNNTTVETVISSPTDSIGSYVFQASQPLGMKWFHKLVLDASSLGGDSLTINYKNNGVGLLHSILIVIPPLTFGAIILVDCMATIQDGAIVLSSSAVGGNLPIYSSTPTGYNRNQENTLSITATWGTNVNQLLVLDQGLSVLFMNGQ